MGETRGARIVVAEHAGACYGVERALELTAQAAATSDRVRTLGPLIHNPRVVSDLEAQGVFVSEDLESCAGDVVVIRSHGVVPEVVDRARELGCRVVDATCPYVKSVHTAARKLVDEGYRLVIVGEDGHPEVEGIVGHAGGDALVVADEAGLEGAELGARVGVVVQTTQSIARLEAVVSALLSRAREVRVVNTICTATAERQRAARKLAEQADAMVVVGGKNSGNTRRLAEICCACCDRTYHVESAGELDPSWFAGCGTVGVTAGASTPSAHIDEVLAVLDGLAGGEDGR